MFAYRRKSKNNEIIIRGMRCTTAVESVVRRLKGMKNEVDDEDVIVLVECFVVGVWTHCASGDSCDFTR